MDNLGWIFFGALIIAAVIIKLRERNKNPDEVPKIKSNIEIDKLPNQNKHLLTKNEWYFYKELKPIADKYSLHILAKIRLADLIEVETTNNKEFYKYFNKIKSKHIDFALCQPDNLKILLIIELDDSSHDTKKGKYRDEFLTNVLTKCGYKIIRTRGTQMLETDIKIALAI